MSDKMATDPVGKLDQDMNKDSVMMIDKQDADENMNVPVAEQSTNQRKRGYPTDESASTSVSSMTPIDMPLQKKFKKEEKRRKRKSSNPRRIAPATSDHASQTLDMINLLGDLPTQGTVPQGEPGLNLQSAADLAWLQFLMNNLH